MGRVRSPQESELGVVEMTMLQFMSDYIRLGKVVWWESLALTDFECRIDGRVLP